MYYSWIFFLLKIDIEGSMKLASSNHFSLRFFSKSCQIQDNEVGPYQMPFKTRFCFGLKSWEPWQSWLDPTEWGILGNDWWAMLRVRWRN